MNPLILVTLLAVGAAANGYGHQEPQINVRVEQPSMSYSPPQRQDSYSPPPQRQDSYSPPPQRQDSYSPPPQKQDSYSAPPPAKQESSYGYSSGSSSSFMNTPAQPPIPILRFDQEIRGSESQSVDFETGNGIRSTFNTRVVQGRPSSYEDENGRMVQTDSSLEQDGHSYHQAPDGQHIALTWRADSSGFHATGDHLPKPVEMPAEHAEAHRLALAKAQSSGSYSNSPSYAAPQQPMRSSGY